jgi:hypothetical protein
MAMAGKPGEGKYTDPKLREDIKIEIRRSDKECSSSL